MGSFSAFHWIIFLLVVVILFGATRLPKIGEGLGKGIKSFRKEIKDLNDDDDDDEDQPAVADKKKLKGNSKKTSKVIKKAGSSKRRKNS